MQREHFPWGCDATHKSPSIQPSQLHAPNHKYHSLLFYLVAAGPKIHKRSSLCCFTPVVWLLTSNVTGNRNLSCVWVPTCGGRDKSWLEKSPDISVPFHLGCLHYFKRKAHTCTAPIIDTKTCHRTLEFSWWEGEQYLMQISVALKLLSEIFFYQVYYPNVWWSSVIFLSNTGGILVSFQ